MSARTRQTAAISVPDGLETARAKLVYLYVATRDGATLDDICHTLDLTKGTALTITNTPRSGPLEACW